MSLRDDLNNATLNQLSDILRKLGIGDLLNKLMTGAQSAIAALTSTQNSTTAASDPTTTQNLANALKTSYNALQVDVAALRTALLTIGGITEQAVTVTSSVMTLAAKPSSLFSVIATTATTTGTKKLLKGPITGPNALVPATGECVWDGNVSVLFATADVVTVASALYAKATDTTASVLQAKLVD